MPEDFLQFKTDDKICAGYLNQGKSVCKGDSGGGLVFRYNKRYYILGIVSALPLAPTAVGGCDSQQYALYTQVSYYMNSFILQYIAGNHLISENKHCFNDVCRKASRARSVSRTKLSERNPLSPCYGHNLISCNSGSCIKIEQQCDGRVDCPDSSDENDCQNFRCRGYFFRCQYGGCIKAELECDGKIDCRDGSDENTFKCKTNMSACSYNEFRCNSGQCIDEDFKCDGKADCADNSDEIKETCKNTPCPGYLFRCKYGACIDAASECNLTVECFDGSDEHGSLCNPKRTVIPATTKPKATGDGSDENTSKCKTNSTCNYNQFRCNSGQCIDKNLNCDGKADCNDNSDETKETCRNVRCPGFTFRCKYGACVASNSECNGIVECFDGSDEDHSHCRTAVINNPATSEPKTAGCILPEHPSFGQWSVYGTPDGTFSPNMRVNSGTILKIECQKQYLLNDTNVIYCENGLWKPSIGQCLIKKCPPVVTTEGMKATCIEGDRELKNCTDAINGTVARFQCAPFYEDLGRKRQPDSTCRDGRWDRKPPDCVPVCGLMETEPTALINNIPKKSRHYPWQVAIYSNMPIGKLLVCIGSLINQKVVLTAAHCVCNPKGRIEPFDKFTLAVGKHYKQYDDLRDIGAQFSEVEEIFVPGRYRGDLQNYVGDIAVLVAKKSFKLSQLVLPVCVDWGINYETELLEKNKPAYVATWNSSYSNETDFDELKEQETEIIDRNTCLSDISVNYQSFLTFDKFCGSTISNETRFRGITSTLVKEHDDSGRYYIIGIASIATKETSPEHILFTNITKYLDFLLEKEVSFRPSTSNEDSDDEYTRNLLPTTPQPEVPQTGCTLPPHPDFGTWKIFESPSTALPGTMVKPGTLLRVTCRNEYHQLDGTPYILCYNNNWSPEIGKCLSICPPLSNTTTTTVTCMFKNKIINCENPVDGTTARFKCVDYYENSVLTQQTYENNQDPHVCSDGAWSQPVIRCQPVCGKKSISSPVLNQLDADKKGYPWQVAIYSRERKRFVCSGSLLNPRVILTAAQCVTTENGSVQSIDQFTVAAGKCFSRDTLYCQFSELSHIFIPDEYTRGTSNYISDIAALFTTKPFTLSEVVQPVCIDWHGLYQNQLNINTPTTGYLTGWSFAENNKSSVDPTELRVQIMTQEQCSATLPNFVTDDKVCVDYLNDTSLCKNNTGSGLVLQHDGRYYITGVLSMTSDNKNCENQLYGFYTKVSQYVDNFIKAYELQFRP